MENKEAIEKLGKSFNELSNEIVSTTKKAETVTQEINAISDKLADLVKQHGDITNKLIVNTSHAGTDPIIFSITIFVLSCFIGYYVVWKVTPALHTPLMSVTNAISGIIILGAMLALGSSSLITVKSLGFFAVLIASINIFGGFVVTHRMLAMFRKK